MPDCGSTTAAPSVRTCPRSIWKGAKPTRSSAAWERCTPGTSWSPRLGVTAKLSADGRTMLRASYGRFSQGVLTGELSPFHPGVTPITTAAFDPATGGYTRIVSVVDPKMNLQLDPETRAPRTDEYSVGVDREVGRRLAVAIAYVRKNGGNFIGWTDVGGQYREETRTLPDGRSVPVFVLVNATADRRFLLTNPEGYSLTYNGLVMVVEKRRSHGWQAFGSYTLSRAYGLQPSSGTTAAGAQVSTVAPPPPRRDVRARSQRSHQRARPAAKRSPAHVPGDGQRRRAADRLRDRRQPAVLQRQAVGGHGAGRAAARATSAFCSSRAARAGCRRKRCSICACRGRSPSAGGTHRAAPGRAQCAQLTRRRRAWRRTICSARISVRPTVFVDPRRAMVSVRVNLGR